MFKKNNTHFIGFLFLAGVMAISVFFCMGQAAAKSITLNKKNFPDKELRRELNNKDFWMGDKITERQLKEIKRLTMEARKRKLNYKGVELFPNITHMDLTEWSEVVKLPEKSRLKKLEYCNDAMQQMSVRQFPQLETVSIVGERLIRLDLSKNSQIKNLSLYAPDLAGLDLSRQKNLEKLKLTCHKLTQFDLSQNKRLKVLVLEHIWESAIDLPSLPRLEELTINGSALETLDLTGFPNLKKITISDSGALQSIRLRQCRKLITINAKFNSKLQEIVADDTIKPKTLKISNCEKMTHLDSLDLSKLKSLDLWATPINNLSSARFPKLKKLSMYLSGQTQIFDFQSLKELVSLDICNDHTIRVLDVSMLPKLTSLSWDLGVVERVKFGKKNRFKKITLISNRLSGAWNLSKFKNLKTFDCCLNKITSLDLGKLDQKLELYCYNNRLKKINAKHVPNLSYLECWGNRGVKVYLHSRKKKQSDWFDKKTKVYYRYQ